MHLTPETVADEHAWLTERAPTIVALINETREKLAEAFDVPVAPVSEAQYREELDAVFADGDLAVNVAAYVAILRDLDVDHDYPGFVVDEQLGRALAGTIAGSEPLRTLGEATFHYADVACAPPDEKDNPAGADDLDAALAAGFQTRLPGWEWTEQESPFAMTDG
ncbi:MAG TPA: hypothetical protein VJ898_03930 [Natrialbaceae archaeon]|nr:hypothetical protein [Natrialbaceae archaeon]